MVQLLHPYLTTGKTIALTIQILVGKVIALLFNTLPRFVIAVPRIGKFIKTENRLEAIRAREERDLLLNGYSFCWEKGKSSGDVREDGCPTLYVCLIPLSGVLKKGPDGTS